MKRRIISLILVLATLFSITTVSAAAAREEEFISEVALLYKDSVEDAQKAIEILKANGEDAYIIGEIIKSDDKIIIVD